MSVGEISGGASGCGDDVPTAFAADVEAFAGTAGGGHVAGIVARLRRPVAVSVLGRAGVGVRTVVAALLARGVPVVAGPGGDVVVLVVNDAVRDDERAALVGRPDAVVALAKADLCGARPDGPMAGARRLAASIASTVGVPAVPVAALLADVTLAPDDVATLRTLATSGADLSSVDAFVDGPSALDRDVRERLLTRLDRFGIAHAVAALLRGEDPSALPAILGEASGVGPLADAVRGCLAAARYRRVTAAVTELRCLTAYSAGLRDVATFASMTAAVDVLAAGGVTVDRTDDAASHLRRAVLLRRYGRGAVGPRHRACSVAVVRGSLRLLGDAG